MQAPHAIHHFTMFGGNCSSGSGVIRHLVSHVTSKEHVIEGSCNFISGSSSLYVTTLSSMVAIDIAVEKIWRFSLSRDLLRPRDQRIMQVYECEFHIVFYHPAKFGGHSHYDNGDIMILVCHIISLDNEIKGSCVLWVGAPQDSHDPSKIGDHRYCGSGDMLLDCHVIPQDHVIKESFEFMSGSNSWYATTLPSLVPTCIVVV